jgi:excinuclease UvrABC helicase subunit UvrB
MDNRPLNFEEFVQNQVILWALHSKTLRTTKKLKVSISSRQYETHRLLDPIDATKLNQIDDLIEEIRLKVINVGIITTSTKRMAEELTKKIPPHKT